MRITRDYSPAAWLRFVCSRDGQYQYDLTYGGVVVVAWADIFFHDTSRFVPHDPNKNADLKVMPAFRQILPATQNVGEVGYFEKITTAIISSCQAVREGKMNSKQGAAQIQKLVDAQYRQYLMDVANA